MTPTVGTGTQCSTNATGTCEAVRKEMRSKVKGEAARKPSCKDKENPQSCQSEAEEATLPSDRRSEAKPGSGASSSHEVWIPSVIDDTECADERTSLHAVFNWERLRLL